MSECKMTILSNSKLRPLHHCAVQYLQITVMQNLHWKLGQLAPSFGSILGFTISFFKQILKVSAFYHEKQKSFIPKKNIFLAVFSKHAKIIPKDGAKAKKIWEAIILHCSTSIFYSTHGAVEYKNDDKLFRRRIHTRI